MVTSRERCTNMTIIEHKEYEDAYPGDITDTMGCTSVREEGKESCQGDSGGPLVYNGSLQGITSWGQDPCAVSRKPRVYTKLRKLRHRETKSPVHDHRASK
ncbi:kallikrein-11-like [Lagenorhynchus albirostris]|uniref:kallikrein-11-like n=1 Tax=Lagenorhynchus albirostris TaxID=27610 RepID=UPI0028E4A4CB|nr:kallikrein-11-like [Lagenorhynchus albirostris]